MREDYLVIGGCPLPYESGQYRTSGVDTVAAAVYPVVVESAHLVYVLFRSKVSHAVCEAVVHVSVQSHVIDIVEGTPWVQLHT